MLAKNALDDAMEYSTISGPAARLMDSAILTSPFGDEDKK